MISRFTTASNSNWRLIVLFLLSLAVAGLCGAVLFPFFPAITWAIALAVATRTPYDWLQRRIHNPTLTAILGVLLVVLLILAPAFLLAQSLVQRAMQVASLIQSGSAQNWLEDTIDKYPWLDHLIQRLLGAVNLRQAAQSTAGFVASHLTRLVTGSITTVTQMVIVLFTLFFLFRDRNDAVRALRSLVPLNEDHTGTLLARMTDTITASLLGRLGIAAIQGCLAGIMFWILGIPQVLLWSLLLTALAMIPSLGAFLVWMPIAVYLALTAHWVKAAILFGWGALVISTIDNLLYPALVGSKLQLHTALLFFAVLGGIALFGVSGIVLGPLVLTVFVTLLQIWKQSLPSQQREDPILHHRE